MALTIQIIRDLVSDNGTPSLLPDPAYQTILDLGETNAYRAAAVACRQLAALFSSKVDLKAGPVSLSNSQKAKAYRELANQYMLLADQGLGEDGDTDPAAGFLGVILTGVSINDMDSVASDTDRPASKFTIGVHNNPETETDFEEQN